MFEKKIHHTPNKWTLAAACALGLASLGACGSSDSDELDAANATVAELEAELTAANAELSELETQLADATAPEAEPSEVLVVGGGPMTDRQQAMVDLITGPLADGLTAADGDAVAAFYTPDGVMYDMEGDGTEVATVSDGTLQSFAERWPGLVTMPQLYVHDHHVVAVVELAGLEVGLVHRFTLAGDPLIESSIMYDSALGPRR